MHLFEMILIIAGSRKFNDYQLLCKAMGYMLVPDEIFSGHAKGADMLGERYANENGIPLRLFPADWNKYGKAAGYERNVEMCLAGATRLLVFWDGNKNHSGSWQMMQTAARHGLQIRVVKILNPVQKELV